MCKFGTINQLQFNTCYLPLYWISLCALNNPSSSIIEHLISFIYHGIYLRIYTNALKFMYVILHFFYLYINQNAHLYYEPQFSIHHWSLLWICSFRGICFVSLLCNIIGDFSYFCNLCSFRGICLFSCCNLWYHTWFSYLFIFLFLLYFFWNLLIEHGVPVLLAIKCLPLFIYIVCIIDVPLYY